MAAPNIGLLIPGPSVGEVPHPDEYTAFFRAADEMGFHSLWATERVLHRIRVVQPFTMLGSGGRGHFADTVGDGGGAGPAEASHRLGQRCGERGLPVGRADESGSVVGWQAGGVRCNGRPDQQADGAVRGDVEPAAAIVERGQRDAPWPALPVGERVAGDAAAARSDAPPAVGWCLRCCHAACRGAVRRLDQWRAGFSRRDAAEVRGDRGVCGRGRAGVGWPSLGEDHIHGPHR